MKPCAYKLLFFLLLIIAQSTATHAQTTILSNLPETDQTQNIQSAFNNPSSGTVIINSKKVLVNGTLLIPKGKVIRIENGCRISGTGTINGGIIEANYQSFIFDTTLQVNPESVTQYFSAKWFGATGAGGNDDYPAIQKAINTCIKNNIRTVFLPVGNYTISRPLILAAPASGRFCTLELLGESSFWDSNMGSTISPSFKNSFAIGIELGKGCKIRKLRINGLFNPPHFSNTTDFYNCSFDKFTDPTCRDNRYSPYAGIVIDPFSNGNQNTLPAGSMYPDLTAFYTSGGSTGGSTGTEIEEMSINNFVVGICSSPNGITLNAEITLINKVQFSNCKLCISAGQAQEKLNTISNIYCWGGTHTIFATGLYGRPRESGNWIIDRVNIAGGVVRFIYNDQHGYFPSYIHHVFAESLGQWGVLNSELAAEISDCTIDFAFNKEAGERNVLTSWGSLITYRSCDFRFYGEHTPLHMEGDANFDHCYFSGPMVKSGVAPFSYMPDFTGSLKLRLIFMLLFIFVVVLGLYFLLRKKLAM